jgi:hypothetical protein
MRLNAFPVLPLRRAAKAAVTIRNMVHRRVVEEDIRMPLVRIDLQEGKPSKYRQTVGEVVYDALVSIGAPVNDRFQVITEHPADGFVFDRSFLGIQRSEALIMIPY